MKNISIGGLLAVGSASGAAFAAGWLIGILSGHELWSSQAAEWAQAVGTVVAIIALATAGQLLATLHKTAALFEELKNIPLTRAAWQLPNDLRLSSDLLVGQTGAAIGSARATAELQRLASFGLHVCNALPTQSGMDDTTLRAVLIEGVSRSCDQYNRAAEALSKPKVDHRDLQAKAREDLQEAFAKGAEYARNLDAGLKPPF